MSSILRHELDPSLTREVMLVVPVMIAVLVPAFLPVGVFAWAAIGCVLAFAVVHPRSVMFAVPLAIPLSFQPVQIGDLQLNMLEVLVAAAAIGVAPVVLKQIWKLRGMGSDVRHSAMRRAIPDRFAALIAVTVLIAGAVSVIFMADTAYAPESLRTFRWTILVPVLYFFVATPVFQRSGDRRCLALSLFIAGSSITAVIAVIDGISGGGIQADAVTRLSGIAPHPNALALILDRAAVPAVLLAILYRDRISTRWLMISALLLIVALLTFSRGALLGIAGASFIVLILARARYLAMAAAAFSAVLLVALTAIAPGRTLSLLGGGSGSMRLELWTSSVAMIRDHPITGVGLDQFLYQYLPRYVTPEAWPERFTSHPHNLLLDSWLSLGIIGVGATVLVGALFVRRVRHALEHRDRISLASAGGILAAAIHGLVDQSYFLPELATSLWLLIMLLKPETVGDE